MSNTTKFRIIVLAFAFAFLGRFSFIQYRNFSNVLLTKEVCGFVANKLETGSLFEAFEGLEQSLVRSGSPGACVSVLDDGRNVSPDCIDPKQNYQTTICKAEANIGVRAEIRYVLPALFDQTILVLWLVIAMGLYLATFGMNKFSSFLAVRIAQEIQSRFFDASGKKKVTDLVGKFVEWASERSGVAAGIKNQTDRFQVQIEKFESRVREESALRARNEVESEESKKYIERVTEIRHNIRSPLSSLLIIKNKIQADAQTNKALSSAIRNIQLLVDDLEQVDRKEEKVQLVITEVVAEEAVSILRPKFFRAKDVVLSIKYQERLSPVMVAPQEFRLVLDNLLENAFDAVQKGGEISLSVNTNSSHCQISIVDNGCGIPAEVIPKLFSKGGTFGKVNGIGVGLYHSKKNVERWHGKIEYATAATGTCFTISLPLTQVSVAFCSLPDTPKVLVIDDDPGIPEALRESGFAVVNWASTYKEGQLLLAREHGIDVTILVDHRLNDGLLGTDLIAEHAIRSRVFLCTNDFDNLEVIRRARQVGVQILPKPLCTLAEPKFNTLV